MKQVIFLFLICYFSLTCYAQKSENFLTLEKTISKAFFKTPETIKKEAYLLKKIAKTNDEIETAYKYLGYIYDLTGKVDSARYYQNKRLNFAKKHFANKLPYYYSVIGFVNWGMEHVDSKILIEELTTALSSINYKEFKQEKGLLYLLMGDVLLRENDLNSASDYFDKSFKLIEGKYVPVDYYMRKSNVAILQNNYQVAQEFLLKGISYIDDKNIYTYPSYLNKLGYTSFMLGYNKKAEDYLSESLHYQKKNNFKTFTAKTYLYLGYLAKDKTPEKEKEYLDKALLNSKNDFVVTKEVYLAFKDYYSRYKNFSQEQAFFNKFNKLNDSIFNTEKAKIKLNLEWRYKLNESKKEIDYKEQIIDNDTRIKTLYAFTLLLLALLLIALTIIYWIKIKNQKKSRKIQKILHEAQLKETLGIQKNEIIKEKIKAKSEERERLALELHDGIANEISSLKLSLYSEQKINNKLIDSTINRIDKLYNDVRNLSHDLSPDNITEIQFTQLVDKICVIAEEGSGVNIDKQILISKHIDNLDEKILLNLYRILQELINNIIKHSKASNAKVEIIETDSHLLIEISDNGMGAQKSNKSGIGLQNIKKRVKLLNGKMEIISLNGFSVKIKLPI